MTSECWTPQSNHRDIFFSLEVLRVTSLITSFIWLEGNTVRKMVLTCCVKGCYTRGGRDKVSFYRIPSATELKGSKETSELQLKRREAWINNTISLLFYHQHNKVHYYYYLKKIFIIIYIII